MATPGATPVPALTNLQGELLDLFATAPSEDESREAFQFAPEEPSG